MIELNVPFMEKDEAKRLGARWNGASKRWYIPQGLDKSLFARWLPEGEDLDLLLNSATDNQLANLNGDKQQTSLSAFLYKISNIIQQNIIGTSWISAEISELRINKGHMFITLVEHDQLGNMIARSSARIWQTDVARINDKFSQGTGSNLESGIKVLICARVEFHPQYGLSLFIEDIDPAYTLGDMAAKLAKIREVLTTEKIINNNKLLIKPTDYVRVAVISPQNAAGLGDFNREAEILARFGLCEFQYFTATFQGEAAPADICKAIAAAVEQHAQKNFDALVIIRGGGALSDLAWLNNEQLARAVCLCPIFVLAGIGHERDYTIIDEVAGERFDTPSKVIQRIFNVVTNNAIEANSNYEDILQKSKHIYKYALQGLEKLQQEIAVAANNLLSRFEERIKVAYEQIGVQANQWCNSVAKQLQLLITQVLTQSPQQILAKGFALVSTAKGKVITSKQAASCEISLLIEFHDGKILTIPQAE